MDFVLVIIEMGNTFTNTIPELHALDTWDVTVIDNYVVSTARTVEDIDKEQNIATPTNWWQHILHNLSTILSRKTPCLSSACSDFQHQRQKQEDGTGLPAKG